MLKHPHIVNITACAVGVVTMAAMALAHDGATFSVAATLFVFEFLALCAALALKLTVTRWPRARGAGHTFAIVINLLLTASFLRAASAPFSAFDAMALGLCVTHAVLALTFVISLLRPRH